jgi:protein kinase-like protein
MTCPRCGNEWDVSKSPCSRCGLLVRLPGRMGSAGRAGAPPQKASSQFGGVPPVKQPVEGSASSVSPGMAIPPVPPAPLVSTAIPRPRLPREAANTLQPSSPPLSPQRQSTGSSPAISASRPIQNAPITPRPASFSSQPVDYERSMPGSKTLKSDPPLGRVASQTKGPNTDILSQKNVPLRPQLTSSAPVSIDPSTTNPARPPQSFRPPSRFVTDPLNRAGQHPLVSQSRSSAFTSSPLRSNDRQLDLHLGTLIRNGRYRLHEMLGRQEWSPEVYEVLWLAQDAQRSGASVMVCELMIPDSKSMVMQSMLRSATMALTSIGRNPHIPTLWDAFSDQGRSFFVFELVEGESLLARMRRTGRAMPEQEVIECCVQMTEVLEQLSQQSPPLIHGQIRPEHIVARSSQQYVLTNFSIVLAGGAIQLVAGVDRSQLSAYTAPEFVRGVIDVRSDLYSLLATAYYLVTGSVPTSMNGTILSAQRLNPNVSSQFDAVLTKGLSSVPSQRYQRPVELCQELLSLHPTGGSPSLRNHPPTYGSYSKQPPISLATAAPSQPAPDIAAQLLPGMLASATEYMQDQDRKTLLPRPEELPLMSESNDWQMAAFWLVGILVCLVAVVVLSRGFF